MIWRVLGVLLIKGQGKEGRRRMKDEKSLMIERKEEESIRERRKKEKREIFKWKGK
jgi:hypothetical protein